MQNFKQFLKEETQPIGIPYICVYFKTKNTSIDFEVNAKRQIKDILGLDSTLEIKDSSKASNIRVYLTPDFDFSTEAIIKLFKLRVYECLHDVSTDITAVSTYIIRCDGFPKFTIKLDTNSTIWPDRFWINCKTSKGNLTSLSGLDKVVPYKVIGFENPQLIKSNVLSLLRIKQLVNIDLAGSFDDNLEWFHILDNHLEDKDILQCQEDLIDAGLKDYAKL